MLFPHYFVFFYLAVLQMGANTVPVLSNYSHVFFLVVSIQDVFDTGNTGRSVNSFDVLDLIKNESRLFTRQNVSLVHAQTILEVNEILWNFTA